MMKRFYLYFLALTLIHATANFTVAQNDINVLKLDKIVLDPGHGGYDSGGHGKTSKEKNVALAIALATGIIMQEELPGIEVIYTRTEDRFVKLHDRAKIANESAADLFISIHCNSNPSSQPFGTETYVMGLHKSEENLEVAKTENAAILLEDDYQDQYEGFDPNLAEDYIMLNMIQSASIDQSLAFSQLLQDEMRTTAGMYDRGVRQAGFVVLYLTAMPGVLLETGFLSNPGEEQFLLKEENQVNIAKAIVEAVKNYKLTIESNIEALSRANETDTTSAERVDKNFRIEFASIKKEKPTDDKMFSGMQDVWHYYENGRYHYTFGKTKSFVQAKDLYHRAVADGKIKWKYLKFAEIIEIEKSKIISRVKASDK